MNRRESEQWEEEVRQALETWGQWQRGLSGAMGGRVVGQYGERTARETVTLVENATAERMDRVLCQVKRASLDAYRVLHWYYYHEASTRDIAHHMRRAHARVRELKLTGEAMAATLWVDVGEKKIQGAA